MDREAWRKAEQIFIACADLADEEQSRLLDERCGDDEALRKLVLSLLTGDKSETDVRDVLGAAAAALPNAQVDRWLNVSIGAYTVEKRLAEGGMGTVFLARRSDDQFDQQVAIKLLPARLGSDALRRRFQSERQILASLQHPNIAMLHDGGETDDGAPYLIMEYVQGLPIDKFCRHHDLSLEQRIELFTAVCAAVQYAHANLVVHRDIKPSNVFITNDGTPKLLDFGIAKLLDPDGSPDELALTQDGSRLYTPRHASPEQVRGEAITTATDVYALGLMLYELVTNEYPYDISPTMSARTVETSITDENPVPPSTHADAVVAKRIRGDLDTIILKCLCKRPEARYQSAAEIADELERYLASRPILARPPTVGYLLARYWRRNRIAVAGIAATAMAIVLGVIGATIGFIQAREAERQAMEEARNAEAISGFLTSLFNEADPNTSAGDERSVRELLDSGRDRIDEELADSPVIQTRMLATLSNVYKGLADYGEAEALQDRALTLAEEHAADDLALLAELRSNLGDLYRIRTKHEEAATMLRDAVATFEVSGATISSQLSDALNNLGLVYDEMDQREQGGAALEAALQMRQQLFEAPHQDIALSLHNLAWHYSRSDNLALAEQYASDAAAMREAVYGETHPRVASSVSLLSRIQMSRDNWDEAERTARKSVAIARRIFNAGHPDLSFPMYELASVLHEKGELQEAADLFGQIVDWERVSLGEDSHDFGMSLKAHAKVLADLGRYSEAESLVRQSLSIFEALPGGSRRGMHTARLAIADLLINTSRLDDAAALLGVDRELGDRSLDTRYARRLRFLAVARLCLARGDTDDAQQALDSYFAMADTPGDAASSNMPEVLTLQAEAHLAAARADLAIPLLGKALDILVGRWEGNHWQVGVTQAALGRARLDNGEFEIGIQLLRDALGLLRRELGEEHPETVEVAAALQTISGSPRNN